MALIDWNIFKSDTKIIAALDLLDPIFEVGSIFVERPNTLGSGNVNFVPTDAGIHPHGRNDGRIRTLIRYDKQPGTLTNQGVQAGVTCLQSQDDLQTTGNCYSFSVFAAEGFQNPVLRLLKHTQGNSGLAPAPDGSTALAPQIGLPVAGALGDVFALQLEWITELTLLGGTQLTASFGTALDYSDLTPVMFAIDNVSPYLTGVSEGIWTNHKSSNSVFVTRISFDQTALDELI